MGRHFLTAAVIMAGPIRDGRARVHRVVEMHEVHLAREPQAGAEMESGAVGAAETEATVPNPNQVWVDPFRSLGQSALYVATPKAMTMARTSRKTR